MADTPERRHPTLVETLAEMPGLTARLLDEHRDDGHGRCVGCRAPGYGTPHERWPCTPARLARAARELARKRAAQPCGDGGAVRDGGAEEP